MVSSKEWTEYICFLLIALALSYITSYYFSEKVDRCTSDPLKFAIEKIKDTHDIKLISGRLLLTPENGEMLVHTFGDQIIIGGNQYEEINLTE